MSIDYEINGIDQLERAIRSNPQYVITRGGVFITRGLAEYRKVIMRQPWRRGMSGGGAPVKTGNLRDTHQQTVQQLEGRIYPTARYAPYIHGISGYARRRTYQLRPWLDFAKTEAQPQIDQHEQDLLEDIVTHLTS